MIFRENLEFESSEKIPCENGSRLSYEIPGRKIYNKFYLKILIFSFFFAKIKTRLAQLWSLDCNETISQLRTSNRTLSKLSVIKISEFVSLFHIRKFCNKNKKISNKPRKK